MAACTPLFRDYPYMRACAARITRVEGDSLCLDRTVFYPQGGGQPGDSGVIRLPDGAIRLVVDTQKGASSDEILHILAPGPGHIAPGLLVDAVIDWRRRHRFMRLHTALHLLSAFVPGQISGAQVGDDKGRIDFALDEGAKLDKDSLQFKLNQLVAEDVPVTSEWIDDDELEARPDLIKTFTIRPPKGSGHVRLIRIGALDLQPCGGTHVSATGEIGPLSVARIENKGRHNRRVTVEFADSKISN
ncbi:MAG: alanyl-tRNA editing protein [Alphaproteobacteria bacterium]|nr:alanyl-tRNA editing protein [Alphaproteobacteria bacterium]